MMAALRSAVGSGPAGGPALSPPLPSRWTGTGKRPGSNGPGSRPKARADGDTVALSRTVQASSDTDERARDKAEHGRYEHLLRAVGAILDREPSERITLVEVPDGFMLRKQRASNTSIDTVEEHLTRDALKRQLAALRRERPRSRRVRHRGFWARFPQGHQDFFRALGHELDAVSARAIVIDEGDDCLAVTYQRGWPGEGPGPKQFSILQHEEIECIVNAAFERRIDPHSRYGLEGTKHEATS
jgi:hypothetical protein